MFRLERSTASKLSSLEFANHTKKGDNRKSEWALISIIKPSMRKSIRFFPTFTFR